MSKTLEQRFEPGDVFQIRLREHGLTAKVSDVVLKIEPQDGLTFGLPGPW